MNKEEIHLAAIKKFGACPIIEYNIPLYSHRQLLDFTTEQCIEGDKQIQRLHQELDLRCEHVKIKDRLLEEANKNIEGLQRRISDLECDLQDKKNQANEHLQKLLNGDKS